MLPLLQHQEKLVILWTQIMVWLLIRADQTMPEALKATVMTAVRNDPKLTASYSIVGEPVQFADRVVGIIVPQ